MSTSKSCQIAIYRRPSEEDAYQRPPAHQDQLEHNGRDSHRVWIHREICSACGYRHLSRRQPPSPSQPGEQNEQAHYYEGRKGTYLLMNSSDRSGRSHLVPVNPLAFAQLGDILPRQMSRSISRESINHAPEACVRGEKRRLCCGRVEER